MLSLKAVAFGADTISRPFGTIEIIKSLGVDHIIDFAKADFTQCGDIFDVVLDTVGKSSFTRCKHLLRERGIYLSSELGDWFFQNPWLAMVTPLLRGKQVKFPIPILNKSDMVFFRDLAEQGKLKAIIDRRYSLDEIVQAYSYVQMGQKLGNVVINVTKEMDS